MCDISAATLNGCADRYKLPAGAGRFLDYQEMYDKVELDMVVICTMDHYEPSIAASKAASASWWKSPWPSTRVRPRKWPNAQGKTMCGSPWAI